MMKKRQITFQEINSKIDKLVQEDKVMTDECLDLMKTAIRICFGETCYEVTEDTK